MNELKVGDIVTVIESSDPWFSAEDIGNIGTVLEIFPNYNYPYYIDFVYFKQYYKFSELQKIADNL